MPKVVRNSPIVKYDHGSGSNIPYYKQQCQLRIPFRWLPYEMLTISDHKGFATGKILHDVYGVAIDTPLQTINDEDDNEKLLVIDDGIRQSIAKINCSAATWLRMQLCVEHSLM